MKKLPKDVGKLLKTGTKKTPHSSVAFFYKNRGQRPVFLGVPAARF